MDGLWCQLQLSRSLFTFDERSHLCLFGWFVSNLKRLWVICCGRLLLEIRISKVLLDLLAIRCDAASVRTIWRHTAYAITHGLEQGWFEVLTHHIQLVSLEILLVRCSGIYMRIVFFNWTEVSLVTMHTWVKHAVYCIVLDRHFLILDLSWHSHFFVTINWEQPTIMHNSISPLCIRTSFHNQSLLHFPCDKLYRW